MSVVAVEGEATVARGPLDENRRESFDAFCRGEWPVLVGVLVVMVRDRGVAEELAQEALARAWIGWPRVRVLERPDLWARTVALNLGRSWWRRQRTLRRAAGRADVAHVVTPGPEPADAALLIALGGLPPRQRAAISLRFLADMSVTDTARVMRCQEGTVKALTSQGLGRLRQAGLIETEPSDV